MRIWLIVDGITKKSLDAAIDPANVERLCCAYSKSYRHELDFSLNNGGNITVTRDERMLFEVILLECDPVKVSKDDWGEGRIQPNMSVSTLPMVGEWWR